jgi:hypothetical protein
MTEKTIQNWREVRRALPDIASVVACDPATGRDFRFKQDLRNQLSTLGLVTGVLRPTRAPQEGRT